MSTFDEIRRIRLDKIKTIRELGINPYPAQSEKDYDNSQVIDKYDELVDKKIHVAGRIVSWREHGALIFCHIQDQSGKLQIFIKKDDLSRTDSQNQTIGFKDLKLLDIGDFIEVAGTVSKPIKGEVSVFPGDIKLLSKAIRSLPEKWSGLTDPEQIFRRRYLDLVMNPDRKGLFIRKSKFWQLNRRFLQDHGFIEVETPIMELVTGGADAKPFITHHNALDQDFYLRISTELFQKRLIGGGFEKIFTLGPNFRNEGIDDEHLQEYYQCEWYWAYADYNNNMDLVENLYKYLAQNLYKKTLFTKGNHTFDLADEWPRISYSDLIKKRFSVDIFNDSEENILKLLKEQHIDTSSLTNRARIVDNLWKIVRQEISGPMFVIDEPKFTSPLAKSRSDNEAITERFHVIIAGSELGNGYSELNDPVDQLERFRDQQKNRDLGDEESQMLDIDFVEMLEYGMPPTSGWGHSERVFWFLENITAREGTLFPQVRYDLSEETKKTYGLNSSKTKKAEDSFKLPDENSKRFVAILNEKIPHNKLANALGHMTAGLSANYPNIKELCFLQYQDKNENIHPNISHFPFIILNSENSNQIRKARAQAIEKNIPYTDFTSTMTIGTSQAQLDATKTLNEEELEYYGLCLFGTTDELKEITKKFSLFK